MQLKGTIQIEDDISEEGNLGVSSYGVSMTSLEEVFLRLGEEEDFSSDGYDKSDLNSETDLDQENQQVSVRVEENMFLPSGTSDRSVWRQFSSTERFPTKNRLYFHFHENSPTALKQLIS